MYPANDTFSAIHFDKTGVVHIMRLREHNKRLKIH